MAMVVTLLAVSVTHQQVEVAREDDTNRNHQSKNNMMRRNPIKDDGKDQHPSSSQLARLIEYGSQENHQGEEKTKLGSSPPGNAKGASVEPTP
tara:strand:+ start:207 stop:485 length:279 start_codon:yes stop_codon:yes gene_type:complete